MNLGRRTESRHFAKIRESILTERNMYWFRLIGFSAAAITGLTQLRIIIAALGTPFFYLKDIMQEYTLIRATKAAIYPYQPLPQLVRQFVGEVPVQVLPHITPHPPTVILLFYPLGLFRYETAAYLWLFIELGLVIMLATMLVSTLYSKVPGWSVLATILGLIGWQPLTSDLLMGQLTLIVMIMVTGAWLLLRQGHQKLGGALLGLAIAAKLFVWPLLLFLAFRRAWRSVLSAVVVILLANLAVLGLLGSQLIWAYYSSIGPSIAQLYRSFGFNFSLTTIGWRLFEGTGSSVLALFTAPPLAKSHWIAQCVSLALPLALLIVGLIISKGAFDSGFSMVLIISLLISPITWDHYFILILIPLTVTLRMLAKNNFPSCPSILFFSLVALFWLFDTITLKRIITSLSTSSVNHEPVVTVWAGFLSYMPVLVLLALIILIQTLKSDSCSEQMSKRALH